MRTDLYPDGMNDVDLRELRYFVAVAEERNFTRAAERLGISQPPLSRTVRRLERRLGVPLLERTTRLVRLTPAGEVFLAGARQSLDVVAATCRRTRRAAATDPDLVVAVKAGGGGGLLSGVVDAYRASDPGLPGVRVVVSGWGEETRMLRAGRADVAVLRRPFDEVGVDSEPLVTERRVVIMHAGHPLAARGTLDLADLRGEPLPSCPGTDGAAADYWAGGDAATATPGPAVGDTAQLMEVVALGQAVALVPESLARRYGQRGVVHRPVVGLSPSTVVVAWPETARSAATAAFVRAATAYARERPDETLAAL